VTSGPCRRDKLDTRNNLSTSRSAGSRAPDGARRPIPARRAHQPFSGGISGRKVLVYAGRIGGKRDSRVQLFSKFFPVHDRVAMSISPSLTILEPSEM
jgi:hypothetical protein